MTCKGNPKGMTKMKKLLMALALLPLMAAAVEFSYEFNSDGANTITLTGAVGAKPAGAFAIPTIYAEKIVTRVGEYAFENNDKITSVLIPGSVKVIARDAFDECRELKSLTIQEGVESIGNYAFGGCALEAIAIPSSLVDLDSGAFSQNPIREFSVAASNPRYVLSEDGKLLLDKIDERLVHCIANPGAVVIPEGIVTIGHGAFEIAAWTSIFFPRTLKCLESGSLDGDKASATELDLKGTSLHRVGPAAFFFSPKLRKIVFPETLKEMGEFAFAGCYALNEVFFNGPPPTIVGETDVEVENVRYLVRREGGVIPEGTSVFMSADTQLKNVSILDSVTTYVPRGKGWDDIVASGTWQGRPIRYVSEGPIQETFVPGEAVSIDTGLIGYTAKGLPSGLKYSKTTGMITGAVTKPTAAEGVIVKFTKSGAETEEMTIVVGPVPKIGVALEGDTDGCKVTGAGAYLVGKKVTLKVTTKKGTAFTGFYKDGEPWPNEADCKKTSLAYTMGKDDVSLVAKFEKEKMSVGCAGLSGGSFTAGVAGSPEGIPLEIETQSGVKSVKVEKLPAGMKYDAKKKVITGAPTKAGDNKVVITVTAVSGAVEKKEIAVPVAAMPGTAVGTFNGFVANGEQRIGTFTLTTTDAGKLTAKVITSGGTVSFSGTCWDSLDDGVCKVTLRTKKGDFMTLSLDSGAAWDANQLTGTYSPPNMTGWFDLSAQRNAFGKTWYFTAAGDEQTGWTFAYTKDSKAAALTVTLKADGSTAIAGKLGAIKVGASGYANAGGMRDGAIIADFAPIVTVNKVKRALSIRTNLWFDRSNDHAEGAGGANLAE